MQLVEITPGIYNVVISNPSRDIFSIKVNNDIGYISSNYNPILKILPQESFEKLKPLNIYLNGNTIQLNSKLICKESCCIDDVNINSIDLEDFEDTSDEIELQLKDQKAFISDALLSSNSMPPHLFSDLQRSDEYCANLMKHP